MRTPEPRTPSGRRSRHRTHPVPPPRTIRQSLGRWYRARRRDLPFRRTKDPFVIWVAETMLQQTRMQTVLGYLERFLRRFPTVQHLAAAPLDAVVAQWAGLGYYRRAQCLHQAAQQIVQSHAGHIPSTRKDLEALPGVGPYTAGAILSIAFGQPEPVLDGNVTRVLCRTHAISGRPASARLRERLWGLAADLVPRRGAGEFNQGMMELGALVCTPRDPACPTCPLSRVCLARLRGTVSRYPRVSKRPRTRRVHAAAAVILRRGKVLLGQHPFSGALGGLWEFPTAEAETPEAARTALASLVLQKTGIRIQIGPVITRFEHAITDRRIRLNAYRCHRTWGQARPAGYRAIQWARPEEMASIPLPSASRRVAQHIFHPEARQRT